MAQDDADADVIFADAIAERAEAFRKLLLACDSLKTDDARAEGLAMLAAIRQSFKLEQRGEIRALKGGKG